MPALPLAALREKICDETCSVCRVRFGASLQAIVLTGSVARDEATFSRRDDAFLLRGDAEFLLVIEQDAALPPQESAAAAAAHISENLASHKIAAKVELSAVQPKYFRKLPRHIFSHELRECGRVIYGDAAILKLIPEMRASDLDREDAWRLLCNRLIELLAREADDGATGTAATDQRQYGLLKLYLDMATSLLVFTGRYAPSYRGRSEALLRWAAQQPPPRDSEAPFSLTEFAQIVARCTQEKLGQPRPAQEPPLDRADAIEYAHLLWRWELSRMMQANQPSATDADLLKQWMRRQPLARKAQGWLCVIRARGWHKSWREWPRWIRLGAKASPRYWTYLVAAGFLFGNCEVCDGRTLESLLPEVPPQTNGDAGSNERLAAAIAWNYRNFLTGTRA